MASLSGRYRLAVSHQNLRPGRTIRGILGTQTKTVANMGAIHRVNIDWARMNCPGRTRGARGRVPLGLGQGALQPSHSCWQNLVKQTVDQIGKLLRKRIGIYTTKSLVLIIITISINGKISLTSTVPLLTLIPGLDISHSFRRTRAFNLFIGISLLYSVFAILSRTA